MEFLKYLKVAAKSNTSVRTRYLQQYNNNDNALHIFYEGNDDPSFYSNFLENKNQRKIYYYQAENKKGVYEIHSKINWSSYDKRRTLFFVDKDFSDILNEIFTIDDNIFVTRYYSIENYVVSKHVFIRTIREILHIDDEKFLNKCYKDFEKNLNSFAILIQPLIAWIIYHRSIKSPLQLNNFKISDLFSINDQLQISKNKLCKGKKMQAYLLEKTKINQPNESWKGILKFYRQIQLIQQYKIYLRGKYEIWVMVTYINKLIEVINNQKAKGEAKIKVQFNLTADNAIELLGPRLTKPSDINRFLKVTKK